MKRYQCYHYYNILTLVCVYRWECETWTMTGCTALSCQSNSSVGHRWRLGKRCPWRHWPREETRKKGSQSTLSQVTSAYLVWRVVARWQEMWTLNRQNPGLVPVLLCRPLGKFIHFALLQFAQLYEQVRTWLLTVVDVNIRIIFINGLLCDGWILPREVEIMFSWTDLK